MNTPALPPPLSLLRMPLNRNILIVASVVVFHVAVLWAMQNGLLRRAVEIVVPAEILTRIIEIEPPKVAVRPPPPPPQPVRKLPKMQPPPLPVAVREPAPQAAPSAPAGVVEPQPPAPPIPAPPSPAPSPPSPPAPPAPPRLVEVTQGETEYVRPPRVVYPSLSKRNGETGVVVIGVYYDTLGYAKRAEIIKSSGFERLDRAAREAVLGSQVTPFRRAGINADTQFLLKAPINFVLE